MPCVVPCLHKVLTAAVRSIDEVAIKSPFGTARGCEGAPFETAVALCTGGRPIAGGGSAGREPPGIAGPRRGRSGNGLWSCGALVGQQVGDAPVGRAQAHGRLGSSALPASPSGSSSPRPRVSSSERPASPSPKPSPSPGPRARVWAPPRRFDSGNDDLTAQCGVVLVLTQPRPNLRVFLTLLSLRFSLLQLLCPLLSTTLSSISPSVQLVTSASTLSLSASYYVC